MDSETLSGTSGHPVRILLESSPGTGALWYVASAPPTARIEARDAIARGPGVGSAVDQVFEFVASAPGTYEVCFQLKRIWEPTVRRERRVLIQIRE